METNTDEQQSGKTLTRVAMARNAKEAEICRIYKEEIANGSMKMAIYDKIMDKYPMVQSTLWNILKRNGVKD